MLSFDVSAIDLVMLVAMLVLLLLLISQKRGQSMVKPRSNADQQGKQPEATVETAMKSPLEKQSAEGFQKCVHQFGYLKKMPKNTPIPDECFGCPQVMRCLFPNTQAPQVE